MGRTEKSQGLAPPAIRKDIRAKQARHIVNQVIPSILASNARAKRGIESSEVIADPGSALSRSVHLKDVGGEDMAYVKRKGQGRRKAKAGQEIGDEETGPSKGGRVKTSGKRRNDSISEDLSTLSLNPKATAQAPEKKDLTIRIITTDSLTAAQILASNRAKQSKKPDNVCILNMASPLRPGGGILAGATSQEEFLCARTTLLPSLKEEYYRLPEFGGIFTPDVLVFRSPGPLGDNAGELGAGERYWVDVISSGMLRFPDLDGEEDEVKKLGKKDREVVERKMRAVLRIAAAKGVKKLILGAWGCGAYGNPVGDVADAWNRVLSASPAEGAKKNKAHPSKECPDLEEVTFAISSARMAKDFARAFGNGGVQVEEGPRGLDEDNEDDEHVDKVSQELRSKIVEMESQINSVWNADLKTRLGVVLDGLRAQLNEREGEQDASEESGSDGVSAADRVDGDNPEERTELTGNTLTESEADNDASASNTDDVDSGIAVRM
ncbi:hypothetical protein B5807_08337 [Epicoccum nigrum]|uniref:Microbial-type PARG catalytic domain-containing protein n=1 Tax=Epicoccum nigrum TaxID=105696 RepID=A0A1Y2LTA3_EPING|nr:hypothetical protein B5807_08337 [Epicoccum nigrum]